MGDGGSSGLSCGTIMGKEFISLTRNRQERAILWKTAMESSMVLAKLPIPWTSPAKSPMECEGIPTSWKKAVKIDLTSK